MRPVEEEDVVSNAKPAFILQVNSNEEVVPKFVSRRGITNPACRLT